MMLSNPTFYIDVNEVEQQEGRNKKLTDCKAPPSEQRFNTAELQSTESYTEHTHYVQLTETILDNEDSDSDEESIPTKGRPSAVQALNNLLEPPNTVVKETNKRDVILYFSSTSNSLELSSSLDVSSIPTVTNDSSTNNIPTLYYGEETKTDTTTSTSTISNSTIQRTPSYTLDFFSYEDKTYKALLESLSRDQLSKLIDVLSMCVLPAAPSQTSQDSESANASVQQRYVVNHAAVLSLHNALLSESRIRQLSDGGATKKWHEEFVRILEMPDNEKKFSLLRNLGQDFVYTAETYGKIIISEMHLPPSEKTIKPVKIGGIAGGSKFICQGILFKFAVDTLIDSTRNYWMYGGSEPATENAMAAAKHELRGVISLYNCRIPNLRVPLMALIDFRGFRLIAQALLPIDKSTLRYGSDDGGVTFHNHPDLDNIFRQAGEKLNLKPHKFIPFTGGPPIEVCGPVDIEGHIGYDSSFYVVDVGRLMPPEYPPLALSPHPRAAFFRMLRPEFVRKFPKPLSSDACTPFGRLDKEIHNKEIEEATITLQKVIIPQFAAKINERSLKIKSCSQLVEEMHRHGINLRYLGLVRSLVTDKKRRVIILMEMILRCLKNLLRAKLRRQMEKIRISIEAPYAKVVLNLLNLVLYGQHRNQEIAATFWTHRIKQMVEAKYVVGLSEEEKDPNYKLNEGLDMQLLLDRLQLITGVKLIPSAAIYRAGKGALLYTDIEHITTVTHHMHIVNYAEGSLLVLLSAKKTDVAEKLRLLSLAEHKLRLAKTAGSVALLQLGDVYYQKTKITLPVDFADVVNAVKCYKGVMDSPSSPTELCRSLLQTLKLYYRHVRDNVYLQRKLFRKKVSALATDDSAMPADQYFLQQCVQYLERLASIDEKGAAKFIKRACKEQGRALVWVLQMASRSSFVASLVIQQLGQVTELDFKSQPQLFLEDNNETSTLTKVFSSLINMKAATTRSTLPRTTETAYKATKSRHKSRRRSSTSTKQVLLPALHSIQLKNCLTLTQSSLASLLRESPSLTYLQLDNCWQITDELANLLQGDGGSGQLYLKKLSINGCRLITDQFFIRMSETNLFSRLRSLNASETNITNVGLRLLAKHATSLEELKLNHCKSVSDINVLHNCSLLKCLELSNTAITDEDLGNFVTHPQFCSLIALNVSDCHVTDASFTKLTRSVRLERLCLSNTQIGRPTLDTINVYITGLTDLDLGFQQKLLRDDIVKLADSLPLLRRLKLVNMKGGVNGLLLAMENRGKPQNIEHLELPWCSIRDLMVMGLHKTFKQLHTVDISGCVGVSNHALMSIQHLSHSLTSLNMSWCSQLVDTTLHRILEACTNLIVLQVAHCAQLTEFALEKVPRSLTMLDISGCAMFKSLGAVPARCLQLKILNAANMNIPAMEMKSLFSFGISLKDLNLKGCKQVTNKFVLRLASYCPLLSSVNLDDCSQLDDESITELCCSCKYIQSLILPGVRRITDAVFIQSRKLGGLRFLNEINLSGCRRITDATVYVLAERSHFLRSVTLSGCVDVSTKSIVQLLQSCTTLTALNIFGCNVDDEIVPTLLTMLSPGARLTKNSEGAQGHSYGHQPSLDKLNIGSTKISSDSVRIIQAHLRSTSTHMSSHVPDRADMEHGDGADNN